MVMSIECALLVSLIQLAGVYTRYIPFSAQLRSTENECSTITHKMKVFLLKLIGVSILSVLCYFLIFQYYGITATTYKAVLLLGWIPYQLVFVYTLPGQSMNHLFVLSLSAVWTFIIHSISCIILAIWFIDMHEAFVLCIEAILYLIIYILTLPLARHYFADSLTVFGHINRPAVRLYFAFLPSVMTIGYMIMISDGILWHTWEERLARLLLPIAFFLTYHYIIGTANHIHEQALLLHNNTIMKQELAYMEEAKLLSTEYREKLKRQLNELTDTYEDLQQLLQNNDIKAAQVFIAQQEQKLSATAIVPYTDCAIVNAAISIYLHRCQLAGIGIIQKINLPPQMNTDENDLAVLLANLLENSLLATASDGHRGQITMILQHNGTQCVLEIANTFHGDLQLGDDGLPKTNHHGHGIGMLSLKNFLKKYDGYADFCYENGWVRLNMYWEDRAIC